MHLNGSSCFYSWTLFSNITKNWLRIGPQLCIGCVHFFADLHQGQID